MSIKSLNQVKKQMTEENIERIYGKKTTEEIITEINPYMFNVSLMENYKELFYRAIYEFINFGGLTTSVRYDKFLKGDNSEEFFIRFREEVGKEFFSISAKINH